jgi:hypothetical protein
MNDELGILKQYILKQTSNEKFSELISLILHNAIKNGEQWDNEMIDTYMYVLKRVCDSSMPKVYKIGDKGKKIVIQSGIHGNEQLPCFLVIKLIVILGQLNLQGKLNNTFYIIPIANPKAFNSCTRKIPIDMNRCWTSEINDKKCNISKLIKHYVDISDLVIDFHEARSFHTVDNTSVGNTVFSPTEKLNKKLDEVIENINKNFGLSDHRAWINYKDKPKKNKSLCEYCRDCQKSYILCEVAGRMNYYDIKNLVEGINNIDYILKAFAYDIDEFVSV